jgi:hypothetical protein
MVAGQGCSSSMSERRAGGCSRPARSARLPGRADDGRLRDAGKVRDRTGVGDARKIPGPAASHRHRLCGHDAHRWPDPARAVDEEAVSIGRTRRCSRIPAAVGQSAGRGSERRRAADRPEGELSEAMITFSKETSSSKGLPERLDSSLTTNHGTPLRRASSPPHSICGPTSASTGPRAILDRRLEEKGHVDGRQPTTPL